ncbi:MAG TPA: DegT/DnrJ/EryC1/StrS family aminotransferase [Lachnospiraceae bacterium]|nr:DegT/DnrJ/EryC1/StrS family aminotransferase [Lachnospiraceae bacterium]
MPITRPYFDDDEIKVFKECLDSGWVTQGPMTERFEGMFREEHPCQYAVSVSSCTAALHIAMLALGIHSGDEVIVPAFTWITSASCVEYVGADVRFVDVEKETMNIDPVKIEEAITPRTKAIIAVHLFGCPAKMDEIMEIAGKHNLYVVEDCACAIGTTYKGKKVGSIGDIGCFSFHPRKAITTGEGGMCSTNNKTLYHKMLQFKNHGANPVRRGEDAGKPYYMGIYDELGYNLRLSDIQAAVGVAQFGKLHILLEDRKRCADYYIEKLIGNTEIILPVVPQEFGHTYQSFVILIKSGDSKMRNRIMLEMQEQGIQSRPGTIAITRTEFNKEKYCLSDGAYPVAEFCEDSSITLPIYPIMKNEEMDIICNVLESCLLS